jgi:XTP/dITP diphosphohydrolase
VTDIVLATKNDGKIKEIEHALSLGFINWLDYTDFNAWPKFDESGDTFKANARIKAAGVAKYLSTPAIADDSGLEVDELNGMPGILSSRFAGPDADDAKNNRKLLEMLKDTPYDKRTARFRCVLALLFPNGAEYFAEGVVKGHIAFELSGTEGFGYDPVFIPEGFENTMADIPLAEKNRISHRGRALAEMRKILVQLFGQVA